MDALFSLLIGRNVPAHLRIWAALAPAVLISAWFILGFIVFLIRCMLFGVPKDAETVKRGGSLLVMEFLRHFFFWLLRPVWAVVCWSGVPPIGLTTLSALLGLGAGVAAADGRFALAGWLFILSGVLDTLDGRLARQRQQATPWGAAIDSILDRVSDMAILIGLAWYYRSTWVLLMCLLSMNGTALVPYIRARGESLGVLVKDGLAQRVERVLCLGVGLAFSPILEAIRYPQDPHPMHWLAVIALVALAITTNFTAAQRLVGVVKALKEKSGIRTAPSPMRRTRRWPQWIAIALATGADFALAYTLLRHFQLGLQWATIAGCLLGAGLHLTLSRLADPESPHAPGSLFSRYLFLAISSTLLNLGGVSIISDLSAFSFPLNWFITRLAVHALWTFPLHSMAIYPARPTKVLGIHPER